jgi:hypothetical protein
MKVSVSIITEIKGLISIWEPRLRGMSEEVITLRRNKQGRTIKQILGHMIDSTSNNIHRIVHLQYQQTPLVFPNYASSGNNERWIAIQNYQCEDWEVMIQLWKYSLLHICHVIMNVNDDKLDNEWIAGPDRRIKLGAMIIDFLRHLKLHLDEVNELIENDM